MSKTATIYAETVAIVIAVTAAAHYLAGLDWPWAIVTAAALSILLRRLLHRRTPRAGI
jgi:membrane protein implicated in regulation of membrane protease activity